MALEPNLQLTYDAIRRAVGRYLGYGNNPDNYTAAKSLDIDRIIASGMRRFYYPPGYEWSFMEPVATLTTVIGDYDYDLPTDFGGFTAPLSYAVGLGYAALRWIGEPQVRELRAGTTSTYTGQPEFASVRPLAKTAAAGQRFEILLYPTPDAAYALTYRYRINPNTLDAGNPYHYGGPQHSETVLTACLAAAEDTLDDAKDVQTAKFQENLAASIAHDKRMRTPDTLGYNGDPSMNGTDRRAELWNPVTYNGVLYES